jgi:hypothetical protein
VRRRIRVPISIIAGALLIVASILVSAAMRSVTSGLARAGSGLRLDRRAVHAHGHDGLSYHNRRG